MRNFTNPLISESLPTDGVQHPRSIDVLPVQDFSIGVFGVFGQMPGIVKRLDLRLALHPVRGLEQHIVSGVGVERRVKIDQIGAFVGDMLAQNTHIIAVIELVGHEIRPPVAIRIISG